LPPQENGQNYDVWVPKVLPIATFDIEQSMFKLSMKSNVVDTIAKSSDVNHVSWLWRILSTSIVLSSSFLEYFKLVKFAMV
jgi:hypothetical protein